MPKTYLEFTLETCDKHFASDIFMIVMRLCVTKIQLIFILRVSNLVKPLKIVSQTFLWEFFTFDLTFVLVFNKIFDDGSLKANSTHCCLQQSKTYVYILCNFNLIIMNC
jgi:hypothetical protein